MATSEEAVKQFAERLNAGLGEQRVQSRSGYLGFGHLAQAIRQALNPPGSPSQEYPRMLYFHGDRERYKLVQNHDEEVEAAAEGWQRNPNPLDPNYPKWMIENPQIKRFDYRGVSLHSPTEEAQWRAVVDTELWMADTANAWGARPVNLLVWFRREERL
jgi:hypothetical protein